MVSVPAETSSSVDADDTVSTISADRSLEIVGHLVHVRLAAARRRGSLPRASLDLQRLAGDGIALEDLDGLGHLADLVAATDAGHLDVELAAGEIVHRGGHAAAAGR